MTKTRRSTVLMGMALGLCAPVVGGCGLGVLSRPPSPDAAPVAPPLTVCDPANLPPGCAETCADAQTILQNDCAVCHESGYNGNLTDVMHYQGLSNAPASNKYPRGTLLVSPGDPDNSLIYKRIVDQEMPPPSSDVTSPLPRPSVSDMSILRQWIQSCIPSVPGPDAGTPPPPVDAETDAAGGPVTFMACPAVPPAGSCSIEGRVCPYPTQLCTCGGGTWGCQSCPAAQPANGANCPEVAGRPVPFACGYGNVTCNCSEGLNQVYPSAWACGVCPATAPTNGQACGNTSISCPYDQQQCDCIGGTWQCLAAECGLPQYTPVSCSGFYSCAFPRIDQTCSCNGPFSNEAGMTCTCPAAAPKIGSACGATASSCVYGDQTCSCFGGWQCTQQCPAARPTDGAACSSNLNCSYGGGLCYCDGSIWHCS